MSDAISSIQLRFTQAAMNGEGLTLSPEEVALLASLEVPEPDDINPDPPPHSLEARLMTAEYEMDNFNLVLSKITPSNPITISSNGIKSPIVWSLFVSWLKTWAKDGVWHIGSDAATVRHNGIEHVISFDPQPKLPLDDSPRPTHLPSTLPHSRSHQ